jgi:hypothetical protein
MKMRETALYAPIKKFLEGQGYAVKAEVKGCDVVATRGNEPPVIVELKMGLTLQLFYQAIDRLALSDTVYIAISRPKKRVPPEAIKMARRLGLGLIVIAASGSLEVLADPEPYAPRKATKRQAALLKEFNRRKGDHNLGGSTRTKLMTAYKQDALRLLAHVKSQGPSKVSDLRKATKVDRAAAILRDDHYGWFTRQSRGIYGSTELGLAAADSFYDPILELQGS